MYDEAVDDFLPRLSFVPDWFDLNDINLDNSFDEVDPLTVIHVRPLTWHIKSEKRKARKKELNEEFMLVTWHPSR